MALAPLSDESIESFLLRWYDELAWAGIYDQTADQTRHRLQEAISDTTRSELHEMAGTPLLLTMMARVNYKKGLPDSRATLYEDYVEQLLWEWERRKQDDQGQPTALDILLKQAGVNRVGPRGPLTSWRTRFTARRAVATQLTSLAGRYAR